MDQRQQQEQLQFNLQITDDTWERLLCALERLEQVTEGQQSPHAVATRLDRHKDKGNIQESVHEVELEVQLQIQAFKYVVSPVRGEAVPWLVKDFAGWMAGRKRLPLGPTDDYAIPVLQCIIGEKFTLPTLTELPSTPTSEHDIRETVEQVGKDLHETDKIQDSFSTNQSQEASQHLHERGGFVDGMDRIKEIAESQRQHRWFKRFCDAKYWKTTE
ncbi:hypothetical protein PMG71_11580 [Roseofilum sp. BLCC_M154]|uniref:Uncharacterized protein n=1 Tax=Roseofilum acuticapitatum BLCC-M154 TaxID=3022444 RepID=A0ABT7AT40_9CYAN|nr:hypothetical protein [Roseofilum acuticapitatum]MDJ1170069.1 hypothetical protein [Roseofilum acuticapitatum BLCC-M154]